MRALFVPLVLAIAIIGLASVSRGQPQLPPRAPPASAFADATAGPPVTPRPGDEVEPKDPFGAYEIGPSEAAVSYEQLTAAEQEVADRGRAQPSWKRTHEAYRAAVIRRSGQARAASAAARLGAMHLDTLGVVP